VLAFGLLNIGTTAALRQAAVNNSRRVVRAAAKSDSVFLENARAAPSAVHWIAHDCIRLPCDAMPRLTPVPEFG
jgi:hypothetical protein